MDKNSTISIKRIYEAPSKKDGYRVLVDRLWPRGIKKEYAKIDEWNKNLSPSALLRKWFDHRADRFKEFQKFYKKELLQQKDELNRLSGIADKKKVTLLYGAKDTKINHAVVLLDILNTGLINR